MDAIDPFTGLVPFVATAEALSFKAAAEGLGVTVSAVSKAVAKLEAGLGVRLLHRTSRRVTLTAEGEIFLARSRDALDRARAAREVVAEAQKAPRGLLRFSAPLPLGRVVVPALGRLFVRHPALAVRALLTDRYVRLAEDNVDVALRVGLGAPSRAVARRLRALTWVTVASPAYLARAGMPRSPSDLASHNCLKFVGPNGVAREWVFASRRGPETVRVNGNLSADHGDSLVGAAREGIGVVQALDFMVEAELARGELVRVLADHAAPGPPLVALSAPGRQGSAKVRAFTAFVAELFAG